MRSSYMHSKELVDVYLYNNSKTPLNCHTLLKFTMQLTHVVQIHKKYSHLGTYLIPTIKTCLIWKKVPVLLWNAIKSLHLRYRKPNVKFMVLLATSQRNFIKIHIIQSIQQLILLECTLGSHCISLWKTHSLLIKVRKFTFLYGEITHHQLYGMSGRCQLRRRHRLIILFSLVAIN